MWRPLRRRPSATEWSSHQAYLVDQMINLFSNSDGKGLTREKIIRATGCEPLSRDPLSIEFFNTIIRTNVVIKASGVAIEQDKGAQIWRLVELVH